MINNCILKPASCTNGCMLDVVNYFMIKVNCVAIYSVGFIIKYGNNDCLKINGLQNIHFNNTPYNRLN